MNRIKEIEARLSQIKEELETKNLSAEDIEARNKEILALTEERGRLLADEQRKALEAFKKPEAQDVTPKNEDDEAAKRGAMLKNGDVITRSVTLSSSGVITPTHQDKEIKDLPYSVVSSLLDRVNVVNLVGGEAHKVPLVAAYSEGGYTAEGNAASEADPTFGVVTIGKAKITAYTEISEELTKLPDADYEAVVVKNIEISIKKKLANQLINGDGDSEHLTGLFSGQCDAIKSRDILEFSKIDGHTLDAMIFNYYGDEDVHNSGVLVLNKLTLKLFATMEDKKGRKLYDLDIRNHTIDTIPYIISSACKPFETASAGDFFMAYGDPANMELDIFSEMEISKSTDYQFKKGLIAYKGVVWAGSNVTVMNGFVLAKKVAAPAPAPEQGGGSSGSEQGGSGAQG